MAWLPDGGGSETHSRLDAVYVPVGTHRVMRPIMTSTLSIGKPLPSPNEPVSVIVHCVGPLLSMVAPLTTGVRARL